MTKNQKFGRPRISNPRSEQINLSFTKSELLDVQRRARALGMRPSHFVRAQLLSNTTELTNAEASDPQMRLIRHELSRLGNNLNQTIRYLHQTGDPLPPDLEPLLRDIRNIIARLSP